jgi:hypothetical protein
LDGASFRSSKVPAGSAGSIFQNKLSKRFQKFKRPGSVCKNIREFNTDFILLYQYPKHEFISIKGPTGNS